MKRYFWLFSSIALAAAALFSLFAMLQAGPAQAAPASSPPARPAGRALQQITPVYTVTDSLNDDVAYNWIEIRGNGGQAAPGLASILDGSDPIDIGFYFPFYENVYSQVRASANGYLYFDNTGSYGANTPNQIGPGDPDNVIAALGAFLYLPQEEGIGNVYFRRDTLPERRFIVEYVNAQWFGGLNEPHTFQVILYPDGRIKVQYRQVRFLTNAHEYVVAGIEDSVGGNGVEYASGFFDQDPTIQNDLAVLYDPGNSIFGHLFVLPPAQSAWEDPGETLDFELTLVNLTGVTSTFNVTYSLAISSSAAPTPDLWLVGVPLTLPIPGGTGVIPLPNTFDYDFQVTATLPASATWFDQAILRLTVTSAASPTISNTAVITYGVAHRDLSIEKELDPDIPAAPGGYFRYRLAVTNAASPLDPERPAPARGVVVTDTLPLSTTLLPPLPGNVVTATLGGHTVLTWTVGDMGIYAEDELYLALYATPVLTVGDVITNTAAATMTASREYGPFANNAVTHTFSIVSPTVVYQIDKYPAAQDAGPGARVDWDIYYYDMGSLPVSGTRIVDQLPISTTLADVNIAPPVTDYSYDPLSHTLVFTLDPLRNGDWWGYPPINVAVTLSAALEEGAVLTNVVSITTTESVTHLFAYSAADATATVTVIDPRADPFVEKRPEEVNGQVVAPEPGGDYTFWVNYGNRGNGPAVSAVLTDTLPQSFVTLLDVVDFGGNTVVTSTPGLLVWEPITLPPGADYWARVELYIHDNTPAGASLVNTLLITAAGGGNVTTTNDSHALTVTLRGADVTLSKHVTPTGALRVGQRLTYTLHFSHVGDPEVPATGVVVSDRLPLGLTNVQVYTASDAPLLSGGTYPELTWSVPDELAYGESGVITLTAEVDAGAVWPPRPVLLNAAEIRTVKLEPYGHAPNSAVVTNAVELAAPYVLKFGPTIAMPGEPLTYTLPYGNAGLLDAHDVRITDTLPVSTTFYTATTPFSRTLGAGYVAWDAGTLPAGTDALSFTLVLSLSPAVPPRTILVNTARIASADYDGNPGNNVSQWRTPVGFDLTPSYKRVNGASSATAAPGDVVTYTVVLTNAGPYSTTDVLLTDPVPPGATYVPGSLAATGGLTAYLPPPTNTVTWTGVVSGHSAISITFQVTLGVAPRGTLVWNEAVISDTANDIVVRAPVMLTGPDLSGSFKGVSSAGPAFGQRVTYTLALSNSGELDAQVVVTDDLPFGVLYTGDGSASRGMPPVESGGVITWTGVVSAGAQVTLTLPVTVVAAPGSLVENEALIADGAGLVHRRSASFYSTGPDLSSSSKTVLPASVAQGGGVEYRLRIYNTGNGPGIGLLMTDAAPPGVSFGAAYFSGAPLGTLLQDGDVLTWTGDLPVLGEVNIRVPATVNAAPGTDPLNVMVLEGPPGNILTQTAAVHVLLPADLSDSEKTVNKDEAEVGETLRYTVSVHNAGELAGAFLVTDTLDPDTEFGGFVSYGGDAPVYGGGVIHWSGTVNPDSAQQLVFTVTVQLTLRLAVTNTAHIADGAGQVYTRTARTAIVEPELSAAKFNTPAGAVYPGDTITYTVVMSNVGGGMAQTRLVDRIPTYTTFIPPGGIDYLTQTVLLLNALSFQPLNGNPYDPPHYYPLTRTITWRGDIAANHVVTVTFAVWVSSTLPAGAGITNTAWVDDLGNADPPLVRQVFNRVVWRELYLPVVFKNH